MSNGIITTVHRNAYLLEDEQGPQLRLHYVESRQEQPASQQGTTSEKEVILLIHGFPQTSYQFRKVMMPLAEAGYRIIAADYRGAGDSSRPLDKYDKVTMANDLHRLLINHLKIKEKVHIVGHDIGAMIAYAYVTQFPNHTASIIWGECPLPGSTFYENCKYGVDKFHFIFHCVPDGLPESLVSGREHLYLKQFFDRQMICTEAITKEDFEQYVASYSMPGAMSAAFKVYRAFQEDAIRNVRHVQSKGKSSIPNLILSGELGDHRGPAREMAEEFFEHVKEDVVEGSSHYIAEENPSSFVQAVLTFLSSLSE